MTSPPIEDRLRAHYEQRTRHLPAEPSVLIEDVALSYAPSSDGRARRLDRWHALTAAAIVIVTIAAVLVSGDADQSQVPTQSSIAPATTSTTTAEVVTTPTTSAGPRADVSSGPLVLVKPDGWYAEVDTQFADPGQQKTDGSVSVATFPLDQLAFTAKVCDEPVAVLEELGPDDVFVTLRYAHPVEGAPTKPLTVADLMPAPIEPNAALLRCLQRSGDFWWQETNIRVGDQKVRVSVAAGVDATQGSRDQLTTVLTSIVARYG